MDTGTGNLAPISKEKFKELEEKEVDGVFRVGQIVELRGSRFRIHAIRPKKIILKILPAKG